MAMFRKRVFFDTDVAGTVYVREPLLNLGVEYEVGIVEPGVFRYVTELSREEREYVLDYLNQLNAIGIQPLR